MRFKTFKKRLVQGRWKARNAWKTTFWRDSIWTKWLKSNHMWFARFGKFFHWIIKLRRFLNFDKNDCAQFKKAKKFPTDLPGITIYSRGNLVCMVCVFWKYLFSLIFQAIFIFSEKIFFLKCQTKALNLWMDTLYWKLIMLTRLWKMCPKSAFFSQGFKPKRKVVVFGNLWNLKNL